MRSGHALLTASVVLVLGATLFPVHEAPLDASPWCFTCDDTWLADFLGNVILFLPLGIALATGRSGLLSVLLWGALLSVGIELAQTLVPGRSTAARDVLSNALGAWAGASLVRYAPSWVAPSRPHRLGLVALAAAFAVVLGAGWLSRPGAPEGELHAMWRPARAGGPGAYRAPLLEATLDGVPLPEGRTVPPEVLAGIRSEGGRTALRVRWGGTPRDRRSLFALMDGAGVEWISWDIRRADLIRTDRSQGARIGLRPRELWFRGAAAPAPHDDELRVTFVHQGRLACARTAEREICERVAPAARGWTLIQGRSLFPGAWSFLMDALWLGALFLPAGLWLRGALVRTAAGVLPLLVILPLLAGMSPANPWEMTAAAAGLALGGLAQPLLAAELASSRAPAGAVPWRSLASAWRQRAMRR